MAEKPGKSQNEGLTTTNIRTISLSPSDPPQLLYLGTNGSGLYRSTDGDNIGSDSCSRDPARPHQPRNRLAGLPMPTLLLIRHGETGTGIDRDK